MVDYYDFRDIFMDKLQNHLPEDKTGKFVLKNVEKVNVSLDGINFIDDTKGVNKDVNIFRTMYMNDMYERYVNDEDMEKLVDEVVNELAKKSGNGELESMMSAAVSDFDYVKDKIVFQMVNTEQNYFLLKDVPHREIKDLSIIYRVILGVSAEGTASAVINNKYAGNLGISEEEMYELAKENTKRLFPPAVKSLYETMLSMTAGCDMQNEMADIPAREQAYIITNKTGRNGAVNSIVYSEDTLEKLAEKLGSDVYFVMSSIHEAIAVSSEMFNPKEFAQICCEVNTNEVGIEERLSNNVYMYDKETKKISIAADTGRSIAGELIDFSMCNRKSR
jgi:hypothetical protein